MSQRIKDNYYERCILLSLFKMFCWDVKLIAIKDMCLYVQIQQIHNWRSSEEFLEIHPHVTFDDNVRSKKQKTKTKKKTKKKNNTSTKLFSYQHLRFFILIKYYLRMFYQYNFWLKMVQQSWRSLHLFSPLSRFDLATISFSPAEVVRETKDLYFTCI